MLRRSHVFRQLAPKVGHIQDKLLINGKFVPALSGKTIPVVNPATEEVIANVAEADKADIDVAVSAARAAFKQYRITDGTYRRDLMVRLADLIHKHREELAALESLDNGKPYKVALNADVALTEQCFRFYAGFADKVYGELAPVSGNNMSLVKRQPIGVCGQVIPWNFPLLMGAWKLAPALAMGNTVVLKPAELTPLSALRLGELMVEAGYPSGTVNIVPGYGATAGAAIALHPDVDKIAFTGSTAVGKSIMKMATETNIKKVSLELGGKSALIVAEDADVDEAVGVAVTGIFFNMGQVCTASSRMYVHESVHDEFVAKLKARAEAQHVSPGCELSCDMGPLVSKRQQDRVLGYIQGGKDEGATLVTGGCRVGSKGYFVAPTIFTDVRDDMKISREEIFGPVVCVAKFKDMEEVVARANASHYGLAAGICTRSLNTAMRYSTFLDAGTVWINTWNMFDVAQPFGGFKESGIGRELGQDAIELYSQPKGIFIALDGPIVKP